jgi:mRNA-degrading endonuclease toxin of MazEF toxin-antitoxin module
MQAGRKQNLMKNIIVKVLKNSIAEELEIEPGDELLTVNGSSVKDYIDYKYQISDDLVRLEIKKKDGEVWELEIEKEYDEDIGIVSAITSQINKAKLPTHIEISSEDFSLPKDSVVLLEQIRTIDKKRLKEKIGHFDKNLMGEVDDCLKISLGLIDF